MTRARAVLTSDVDTDNLHLLVIYLFIELFHSERLPTDNVINKIRKCVKTIYNLYGNVSTREKSL